MSRLALLLWLLLLCGCGMTQADRLVRALNDPLSHHWAIARQMRPLRVQPMPPQPERLATVRAAQRTPRLPYAPDLTLEVW